MNNETNFIQLTEAVLAKIAAGAGTSRDVIFNCSYICPPVRTEAYRQNENGQPE